MRAYAQGEPLLEGVTAIEASAGTGKTYSIANVFLRAIAIDGVPIDEIVVLTFTNAAAAELRERLHKRLQSAGRVLEDSDLSVDDVLCSCPPDIRELAHKRVTLALQQIDRACISTIHAFCQMVLVQFPDLAGVEPNAALVSEADDLLERLLRERLIQAFDGMDPEVCRQWLTFGGLSPKDAWKTAKTILRHPTAHLEPAPLEELPSSELWISELRTLWQAQWQELYDLVVQAKGYRKRLLKQETTLTKAFDRMTAWLEQDAPDFKMMELGQKDKGDLRYFFPEFWTGQDEMDADIEDKAERVREHGLFQAIGSLPGVFASAGARFLAQLVRSEFGALLDQAQIRTFDTILLKVRAAVIGEAGSSRPTLLTSALRDRYKVALIDEFQDTDPVQWEIFEEVFAQPGTGHRLCLIGDPKQSIYRFRNADVFAYLNARSQASTQYTMKTNYRSDGPLIDVLNAFYGRLRHPFGKHEGQEEIAYEPVFAAEAHQRHSLMSENPALAAPFRLHWFESETGGKRGDHKAATLEWLAGDVCNALSSLQMVCEEGVRPVAPEDIAVLVRSNQQARDVACVLGERGVPVLISEVESIWQSREARAVGQWVEAMIDPTDVHALTNLATSLFFLFPVSRLPAAATPDDDAPTRHAWDDFCAKVADWSEQLGQHGISAAFRAVMRDPEVNAALLQAPDPAQSVTNLRHLLELLQRQSLLLHGNLGELQRWVQSQRKDPDQADSDEAKIRRARSMGAVSISTIHKAKGLEYPIVYAPFLWLKGRDLPAHRPVAAFHESRDDGPSELVLDMSPMSDPAYAWAREREQVESEQEEARLLYVALTRAKHQLNTVFVPTKEQTAFAAWLGDLEDVEKLAKRFAAEDVLVDIPSMSLTFAESGAGASDAAPYQPEQPTLALTHAVFGDRAPLGIDWRVSSFSSLKALSHPVPASSASWQAVEPETDDASDRDEVDEPELSGWAEHVVFDRGSPDGADAPGFGAPVVLSRFPQGAGPGLAMHAVFEHIDFTEDRGRPDLYAGVEPVPTHADVVAEQFAACGLRPERTLEPFMAALPAILRTPLGEAAGGVSLSEIACVDRLSEVRFDLGVHKFPKADRDTRPTWEQLYQLTARDPAFDEAWRAHAGVSNLPNVDGLLTGAIDLLYRVPQPGGTHRYFIADYKSNRIAPYEQEATLAHYTPACLRDEIGRHAYFVQATLYVVALQRLLKQRLRERYDYDVHVGGAVYLFVRGMHGQAMPGEADGRGYGVWTWRPSRALVDAIELLLGGGAR